MRHLSLVAILIALPVAADDRDALVKGVQSIACPGLPGPLAVFGQAMPVVAAGSNVVIAAGPLEKGRVVAFGHDGFFNEESLAVADTRALIVNALRWTGRDAKAITVHTRGYPALARAFNVVGLSVRETREKDWIPEAVEGVVLVVSPGRLNDDEAKRLRKFVAAGGGLLTGTPGWGWRQVNGGKTLDRDMPMNRVLAEAGLVFADGTIDKPRSGQISIKPVSPLMNATAAITAVEAWLAGGATPGTGDAAILQAAIANLHGAVPESHAKPLYDKLTKSLAGAEKRIPIPTAKKTLKEADGAERLLFSLSNTMLLQLPPAAMKPHPAASEFPGKVEASAPRITKNLILNISSKGYICDGVGTSARDEIWHSTGLYAAPGESITITIPAKATRQLGVRIGAHTDTLWNLKSWQRAPEISRRETLVEAKTLFANPFGGLVYIITKPGIELGPVEVTIAGAVAAPYFEAGKTTAAEWSEAKKLAAPWTEFASKKIVLTIPSALARTVADPGEVLAFWDKVLDADADLTCVSRERGRAERFVHDVQISAGYMHSGYPIMCPLKEAERAVDVKRIEREGAWGYFHELGHNHQAREWTFDGTTEVTCNLYSLYCHEKLCPNAPLHESIRPEAILLNSSRYVLKGRKFDDWKQEPFTALIMYKQLKDEFGWDAYTKAFKEYQRLNLRPRNDAAERDEWLVQMSKATGRNLGPFFDHWGVPVSAAAKKKVEELKAWMPAERK